MKKNILIGCLVLISGCSLNPDTVRDVTAVQLGCAPVDVTISNYVNNFPRPHSWNATCNGKKYLCMSRRDDNRSTTDKFVAAATCTKVK